MIYDYFFSIIMMVIINTITIIGFFPAFVIELESVILFVDKCFYFHYYLFFFLSPFLRNKVMCGEYIFLLVIATPFSLRNDNVATFFYLSLSIFILFHLILSYILYFLFYLILFSILFLSTLIFYFVLSSLIFYFVFI